ncbi:MAG TPA: methyltransferase domain-containing protein [Candidatus Paceibacterota bacterium]|jgi:ubiquinone/menaquinone biosynthesis C-methylase UbiE|nr:hypothetical protein [Parcubacteria group bacterium]MDP6119382.1 methyltransferase domain-containing protein [Candidatus Paceibacterota bacterium]HJN62973.1 methyltransferase domain-containing protein [Candidatus Paceibacterota bacterium]|tara:strand:+ start:307 stop:840 length:534 start_codon:yes stop_codon:yes gene_type:complete
MAFTDPKENLKELNLNDGMVVADLGAGVGNYTMLASKEVGSGKVYAIDVQNGLLEKLQNDAIQKGISNIEIIWANLEKEAGSKLADNSVDAVIISNILFLIEDKNSFIAEAKRILRTGGEALVVDWSDSFSGLGPQQEHILSEEDAQKLFKDNNFEIKKILFDAGEHHYGFIAKLLG